jgi:hypothetical protein
MCAGRALCGFSISALVVCALCLSLFFLGCVEPLPLTKGSETCLLQVIFLFAFLAFDRLLEFLFVRFFSFSFLSCYFMLVLSMHS